MSEVKRSLMHVYLNTGTTSSPTWSLVGDGVTDLSIDYNPQTKTEQYINQDSATTILTGYQPTATLSTYAYNKDENSVYDFLNSKRTNRSIGSNADAEILIVDVYSGTESSGAYSSCSAEKQKVNIQINSYGGSSSDPLTLEATLNFKGKSTLGTAAISSSGTVTFTENS